MEPNLFYKLQSILPSKTQSKLKGDNQGKNRKIRTSIQYKILFLAKILQGSVLNHTPPILTVRN